MAISANTHHHHLLASAILLIVGTHILGNQKVSAQCQGIVSSFQSKCSQFVQIPGPKVPPSDACCEVVKDIKVKDVSCICKFVTPDVEKVISMEKAVYVARTCGLSVPPGTICGSYTVPPKFV